MMRELRMAIGDLVMNAQTDSVFQSALKEMNYDTEKQYRSIQ